MTNTASVEPRFRDAARLGWAFPVAASLLFGISATVTVSQCIAMADMPGMAMPGGWQMSMMWMRMPGESWPGVATAFVVMWTTMMIAMMLPTLCATLHRYRTAVGVAGTRLDRLTAVVAAGYFAVWAAAGVVVCAAGFALAALLMQWSAASRAVPLVSALLVIGVGVLQFSAMKARQLACCARMPRVAAGVADAWRLGVHVGVSCCRCCAGFTLLLLLGGAMDLVVMGVVTVAISAERLAAPTSGVARGIGAIVVAAGLLSLLRASGFA